MDNLAIARVLAEIGDLLEIKGENPFKIRAYRNAAETVAHTAERLADLTPAQRLAIPGIGKDLAAKIGELIETGAIAYHQELLQEFPGDDPRSPAPAGRRPEDRGAALPRAAHLHARRARGGDHATAGCEALKGVGEKKAAQMLRAIGERAQLAGRRLLAEARDGSRGAACRAARARAGRRHHGRRQPAPRLRNDRRPRHSSRPARPRR